MDLEKYYREWNHNTEEEMERLKNNVFSIEFILSCGEEGDKIELCNKLRRDFYILYREKVVESSNFYETEVIEEIKKKYDYIINEFAFELSTPYYQNPDFLLKTIFEFYELCKQVISSLE